MTALEWINDNRDWIFSGIGGSVIIYFFQKASVKAKKEKVIKSTVASSKVHLEKSHNNTVQTIAVQNNITQHVNSELNHSNKTDSVDIDPAMIKTAILSAPLYQRSEIGQHYIGVKVNWILRLITVYKRPEGKVLLAFWSVDAMSPTVSCTVNLADYPYLKIAKDEELFNVDGVITQCSGHEIELEVTKLTRHVQVIL